MKLCVAQIRSVKGDIERNVIRHLEFIQASEDADVIVFPELSLTGYEPTLAGSLAISVNDKRLDAFQTESDTRKMMIGVGVPTRHTEGVYISMIIFQPLQSRLLYSKKYIHADEEPFFVSGKNFQVLKINEVNIGPAICYELSVSQHAEDAVKKGAHVYIASVAKSAKGIDTALTRLSNIAKQNGITVLVSNGVGAADDFVCAGKSAIFGKDGSLLAQLDEENEGLLVIDLVSGRTTRKGISAVPSVW